MTLEGRLTSDAIPHCDPKSLAALKNSVLLLKKLPWLLLLH